MMLAQNPLRTNFQQHYEQLVAQYNEEKDEIIIQQTFEALLRFVATLNEEESRAVREGLDEETLALFDLLKKDNLTPDDIKRIKAVAVDLHAKINAEMERIRDWESKYATRDAMKQTIYDYLYSDTTGLPDSYSNAEIEQKSEVVYVHILHQYQHNVTLAVR